MQYACSRPFTDVLSGIEGGRPRHLFECFIEMGRVLESHLLRDHLYPVPGREQSALGLPDAHDAQIFAETEPRKSAEHPAEVRRADIKTGRRIFKRKGLAVMLVNVAYDFANLVLHGMDGIGHRLARSLFYAMDADQQLGKQASHRNLMMRSALFAFTQHLP